MEYALVKTMQDTLNWHKAKAKKEQKKGKVAAIKCVVLSLVLFLKQKKTSWHIPSEKYPREGAMRGEHTTS